MFFFRLFPRVALLLAWAGCSLGEQIVEIQGGNGINFTFVPLNTVATVGETVTIRLPNGSNTTRTVVQASFDEPCQYMAGGFHSGPIAADPNQKSNTFSNFSFVVRDSNPIYFNFGERICSRGMAGGVNTPAAKSAYQFRQRAIAGAASSSASSVPSPSSEVTAPTVPANSGVQGLTSSQVKIATSLVIVAVLLMAAGAVFYLRRVSLARQATIKSMDPPELEAGSKPLELDAEKPAAELGMKSPNGFVFELSAEEVSARQSKTSLWQKRGSLYFWRAEIRPSRA